MSKKCKTIDLRGAQVNEELSVIRTLFSTCFHENTIDYTKTLNIGNISIESCYFNDGVGYITVTS